MALDTTTVNGIGRHTPTPPPTWRRKTAVGKRNGKWHVVLLAGAPDDVYLELKERWEEEIGVEVRHHWDREHPKQFENPVPKDVDLVVVMTSWISHANSILVHRAAKTANVPLLRTSKHRSAWQSGFYRLGLPRGGTPLRYLRAAEGQGVFKEPEPPKYIRPVPLPIDPPVRDPAPVPAPVLAAATSPAPAVPTPPVPLRLGPPPLAAPAPRPVTLPPVEILVAQQTIPVTSLPARRPGIPSPETAALAAALQARCADEGLVVMVGPTSLEISAAKGTT